MKKIILIAPLLLFTACSPFFMFKAPTIKTSRLAKEPAQDRVEIAIDNFGIPFIKANSTEAAMYAMGFMHAHDRLFQLDLTRYAALGRMSEMFGERTLLLDKKLRILSYRLDEQTGLLTSEEQRILEAYVRGVNEGAIQRGRSAEHFLLGIEFKPFLLRDVVAIARLQSWQLAADVKTELDRLIITRSSLSDAEKQVFLSPVEDRQSSIIPFKGTKIFAPNVATLSRTIPVPSSYEAEKDEEEIIQSSGGASNAWVVAADLMKNQHAVLMNDPHLRHSFPSNFYLANIETKDMKVQGASLIGVPSIVIGASKHIAWGVTASYLNTQDSVLLKRDAQDPLAYSVDDKKLILQKWPQEFCLKNGQCSKEDFYISIFGPVMDTRHDSAIAKEDFLALMWTGFLIEQHSAIASTFIKLARAATVSEGAEVIKAMSFPGVNIVLADKNGDIGYAYAGLVPARDMTQFSYLPLDGSKQRSRWSRFLAKPVLLKPERGFIVTANQNIFSAKSDAKNYMGKQGAAPYRALKIQETIGHLKEKGPLSVAELAAIQLDSCSIEARELSSKLGFICQEVFKDGTSLQKEFAQLLTNFDGNYTVDSLAALPYETMINMIISTRFHEAVGAALVKKILYSQQLRYALSDALLQELNGKKTGLFGAKHPIKPYLARLCGPSFTQLVNQAGSASFKWRWGRHHYIKRESPLGQVPVLGEFFRDKKREVAGSSSSPLAETGTPVIYGANLRFQAIMSDPPVLKAVLDTGNNGDMGNKNSLDQSLLWHQGQVIDLAKDWSEANEKAKNRFSLAY